VSEQARELEQTRKERDAIAQSKQEIQE